MKFKTITIVSALLLTACGVESDGFRTDSPDSSDRVDSCDLRQVSGTCMEYTLSELDDWYREFVQSACPKNRRGLLAGTYKENARCPSESRVARCEDMIEDPAERYEYDKHYYAGTADGYSWQPANVQVTCKQLSGHFVPE